MWLWCDTRSGLKVWSFWGRVLKCWDGKSWLITFWLSLLWISLVKLGTRVSAHTVPSIGTNGTMHPQLSTEEVQHRTILVVRVITAEMCLCRGTEGHMTVYSLLTKRNGPRCKTDQPRTSSIQSQDTPGWQSALDTLLQTDGTSYLESLQLMS